LAMGSRQRRRKPATVYERYEPGGLLEQAAAAERRRASRNRELLKDAKHGGSTRKGKRLPWEGC
jgi:hypothetical protein